MELESFNIWFEHIKGENNILADTLSCLIDIDPDTQLTPEGNGYEFGYAVFEELPDIHTFENNEVIAGNKEIRMIQTCMMLCSALTTRSHLND